MNIQERKLRKLIRTEIKKTLNESYAEDDMRAWEHKVYPVMTKLMYHIENHIESIDDKMSDFNSPGARATVKNAITNGFDRRTGKFDADKAIRHLKKYSDR